MVNWTGTASRCGIATSLTEDESNRRPQRRRARKPAGHLVDSSPIRMPGGTIRLVLDLAEWLGPWRTAADPEVERRVEGRSDKRWHRPNAPDSRPAVSWERITIEPVVAWKRREVPARVVEQRLVGPCGV